ncbi:hypothetical protein [Lactobacillus acetotolerans]|jgi:hypothetical protein|uniref:Uncharacterized protein n=1 Tax=Lactobacillus acetotolerans TaxID=1600 RepID=A0A0D6A644_9LACO|nr:hypothetical protein [Lactobacillus acetotolerans]BAQ57920.1 hypothetical protein LBAT_1531 [Lactobacillus acetotolerans]
MVKITEPFADILKEELKDPKFKKEYEADKHKLESEVASMHARKISGPCHYADK